MQQSRWILASAIAPLLLLSCGNAPPVPAPPAKEAALSTAISSTGASNDSSTVTYSVTYSGTHQYFRVYVDADRAAGTGFGYGRVGAEFLIENGSLYRYTGDGSSWSWASAGTATFANASGGATWTVARSALGLTDPCASAANLLFDIDDGVAPVLAEVLTPAASCATATPTSTSSTASVATPTTTSATSTGISDTRTSNDATNAQYSFAFASSPSYWRVYVDSDNNGATGFAAGGGVGAEFLIEGSGVYRYVGPGWSWSGTGSATFSSSGGTAAWSVSRALIAESAACGARATLLFEIEDAAGHTTDSSAVVQTFVDASSCTSSGTGGTTPTPTPTTSTGGTTPTPTPATSTGGTTPTPTPTTSTGGTSGATAGGHTQVVFVIAMENEAQESIYGNSSAPYINQQLIPQYARATAFNDPLPDSVPSEPHYVWMEAGTNKFSDTTFLTDADPDASNSTASTAHLTTQMMAASPAVSWLSFQEGLNSSTGACPISSSGFYAAKHDPFVFFQDISGRTPSATSSVCVAHHKAYTTSSFAQALSQGTVAQYNFITPNLCNDMHGESGCPSSDVIAAGDSWLAANLPPIIQYANAHNGVIFLVWDEPEGGSPLIPFLAIGPHVKAGYASSTPVTHSALVKTVENIFGLPPLPAVSGANDFGDLFQAGYYP